MKKKPTNLKKKVNFDLIGKDGYVLLPKKNTFKKKKITLNDFKTIKELGKGTFASVLLVEKKDTGKKYAMKIIKKETCLKLDQVEHTKTERVILQYCAHPYIVPLHFAFQTETDLFLVLEYIEGKDLFYHLRSTDTFDEHVVKVWAAQILLALNFLHENNIMYRDLKPENILIDKHGNAILADFGLAKILQDAKERAMTLCGTPEYLAPELIFCMEGTQVGYNAMSDYWNLGVLIYELLLGGPPYYVDSDNEVDYDDLVRKMKKQRVYWPRKDSKVQISKEVIDLIKKLLVVDSSKRIGAKDENEIFEHPWFNDIDFNEVFKKKVKVKYDIDVNNLPDVDDDEEEEEEEDQEPISIKSLTDSIKKRKRKKDLTDSIQQKFMDFSWAKSTASMSHSMSHSMNASFGGPKKLFDSVTMSDSEEEEELTL